MSGIPRRGLCLVLAGPSGGGKTSVARALLEAETGVRLSISVTTRPPRPAERDGVDYLFRSVVAFEALVEQGALLEWARVLGRHFYGTPREPVMAALAGGEDLLFDIDWQGFNNLRSALPGDVVGVFLLPPSLAALRRRLEARGGEDRAEIDRRMDRARGEISHAGDFDHVIVNESFDTAVARVRDVLWAARTATERLSGLRGWIGGLEG